MKPTDFLDSAKQEVVLNKEVNFRNATSRAYYAAYHSALWLNKEIQNHSAIESGGVHKQFISKLENCPHYATNFDAEKITAIGYLLKIAHRNRINADYKLEKTIDASIAKTQISNAERIIEELNNLS